MLEEIIFEPCPDHFTVSLKQMATVSSVKIHGHPENHVPHNLLWSHQRIVKWCVLSDSTAPNLSSKLVLGLKRQHVWIDICANISKYVTLLQHMTTSCWNSSLCLLKSKHLSVILSVIFSFYRKKSSASVWKNPNTLPSDVTIFQGEIALFFASLDPEIG